MDKPIPTKPKETAVARTIDLDQFKTLYYLLNAKPDSQVKLLTDDKIVNLQDIIDLNDKVQRKLKTEHVETVITTVTVLFNSRSLLTFNNWQEFLRTDWKTSEQTKSMSINWDINIKLPQYELPQRHTLKLRLGSPVRPGEILELMITADKDEEILEATANGVCKIDFINEVIANELLKVVDEWFKSLANNQKENSFQLFSEKHKRKIAFGINLIIPMASIVVAIGIVNFKLDLLDLSTKIGIQSLLTLVGFGLAVFYAGDLLGKVISTNIYNKVSNYKEYSIFQITKGDQNSRLETERKNNKIAWTIIRDIVVSLMISVISLFFESILEKVFK
ncbi:MAG: hypothetical protein ACOYXT_13675 [Bacteroidota bacterium]